MIKTDYYQAAPKPRSTAHSLTWLCVNPVSLTHPFANESP